MNLLYSSVETDKNAYNYGGEVGIIGKNIIGTEYDAIQDQNIESNKEQISETKHDLRENEARDDTQQAQLDANDAVDVSQQSQIDETISRLNANIADDERQQGEINENRTNITRIEGELPTLNFDGTTLVIGKRGDE